MKPYSRTLVVLLLPLLVLALLQWGPNEQLSPSILKNLEPWQQHLVKADAAKGIAAVELKGRLEYGAASALLRIVAVLAIVFALIQLSALWRANAPPQRRVIVVVPVVATILAIAYAIWQSSSEFAEDIFLSPVTAAQAQGLLTGDLDGTLKLMAAQNFLFGYVAAGLLLSYLACLTIEGPKPIPQEDRLVGLQFVLAIGAVLFSVAILTDKTSLVFATGVLHKTQSADLIAALNRLPDIWALSYSGFLITAVGAAYFGIRGPDATVNPQLAAAEGEKVKDSPLALRTPSGKDFKIFGWLVNLLIAFAPFWAASLGSLMSVVKTVPQ